MGVLEIQRRVQVHVLGVKLVMQDRCHANCGAAGRGEAVLPVGLDDGAKKLAYLGRVVGCEEPPNREETGDMGRAVSILEGSVG